MTTETAQSGPQWAHRIAPEPNGLEYLSCDKSAADLPKKLARYHAARAYGFYSGAVDGSLVSAIRCYLYEYELAWLWHHLSSTPEEPDLSDHILVKPSLIAGGIVTDLASPHVIGPNILHLLEQLGIDPASIRPYGTDAADGETLVAASAPVKLHDAEATS